MALVKKDNAILVRGVNLASSGSCCCRYRCSAWDWCPCRYAKNMPATLTADLTLDIGSTIYGFANTFDATYGGDINHGCTKLTQSQAATRNGTYTLVRETGRLTSEFFFSPTNGSLCSYSVTTSDVTIRVVVGVGCGATNSGQATLSNTSIGFNVPARVSRGLKWSTGNPCNSPATNAASRDYVADIGIAIGFYTGFNLTCTKLGYEFRLHNANMEIDTSAAGSDRPQCEAAPIKKIDHTWRYDVIYADTTGASIDRGRVSRALTLRVRDQS
jgi:hypothetical protein